MQDVSKHVRLQREHLNKHDQTYTWFEIDLTAKTIRRGKKTSTYFFHTYLFYKLPRLDPKKKFAETKTNKLYTKWQDYTPQNHNIKHFMEGVDPCHFIEEK